MIINKLKVSQEGGKTYVSSRIIDECSKEEKTIFFSVPNEYAEYLVTYNADAFVLATLIPAIVTRQNIIVKGAVSDSLMYNLTSLRYLLEMAFESYILPESYQAVLPQGTHTQIIADSVEHFEFKPTAVATGFSGGIDSLSTFINHTSEECPDYYKITHLALFNIGSYGDDYEKTSKEFEFERERALKFAQQVDKPLVLLDSNIGELCRPYNKPGDVRYRINFASRLTLSLSAGVWILQKLFKIYYVSSGVSFKGLVISRYDQISYENILAQLLSNTHTALHIGEATLDRVEKTRIVVSSAYAHQHLYVCAASILKMMYGGNFDKDGFPHCGSCLKCIRTMLTLDFLGVLDLYASRFNLKKYTENKDKYILQAYETRHVNHFNEEICQLIESSPYELSHTLRRAIKSRQRAHKRKQTLLYRVMKKTGLLYVLKKILNK